MRGGPGTVDEVRVIGNLSHLWFTGDWWLIIIIIISIMYIIIMYIGSLQ